MRIQTLFSNARYVGQAEGDRTTYHVFEASAGYLLVAPSSRGTFYVNVIDREAPDVITRKFKGQRLTAAMLRAAARRPELFGNDFQPLNALYVMTALGKAKKLKRRDGKALVFRIR